MKVPIPKITKITGTNGDYYRVGEEINPEENITGILLDREAGEFVISTSRRFGYIRVPYNQVMRYFVEYMAVEDDF